MPRYANPWPARSVEPASTSGSMKYGSGNLNLTVWVSTFSITPCLPLAAMAINGKQGVIEKVDTHTVRFKFPEPYFMLPDVLAGSTDLAGQGFAYRGMGGFAPAHYLKQFHPRYVGEAELDRKVKEAKFDSWVRMFLAKNDWALNPDLPVLSPWKTVTAINTATWTLERNPYSVFVDTEGNQLPYIDRVVLTLAENLEVVNLRAIAGE